MGIKLQYEQSIKGYFQKFLRGICISSLIVYNFWMLEYLIGNQRSSNGRKVYNFTFLLLLVECTVKMWSFIRYGNEIKAFINNFWIMLKSGKLFVEWEGQPKGIKNFFQIFHRLRKKLQEMQRKIRKWFLYY